MFLNIEKGIAQMKKKLYLCIVIITTQSFSYLKIKQTNTFEK